MSTARRAWATSSHGDTADSTPMELAVLREHKQQCSAANGRLVALQCGAALLATFLGARLVTSTAAVAAVAAALLLWW